MAYTYAYPRSSGYYYYYTSNASPSSQGYAYYSAKPTQGAEFRRQHARRASAGVPRGSTEYYSSSSSPYERRSGSGSRGVHYDETDGRYYYTAQQDVRQQTRESSDRQRRPSAVAADTARRDRRKSAAAADHPRSGPTASSTAYQQPCPRVYYNDTSDSADDSPSFSYVRQPRRQRQQAEAQYYSASSTASPSHRRSNSTAAATAAAAGAEGGPRSKPRSYSSSHSHPRSYPSKQTCSNTTGYSTQSKQHVNVNVDETYMNPPPSAPRTATARDALRYKIPAGYSLKNWDPDETPLLLLGSVFDANSLGKWVYDWTVYTHGPATPMGEVAGDLWLLLIKLAHKLQRARARLDAVKNKLRVKRTRSGLEEREHLGDVVARGDVLWGRLEKLIKKCEEYMWKSTTPKRSSSSSSSSRGCGGRGARGRGRANQEREGVQMGPDAGKEFVASMFGRGRYLEQTEGLMQGVRHWMSRVDGF